jgi:uncharacterized protein YggU (UPF0235/DUF167 family)
VDVDRADAGVTAGEEPFRIEADGVAIFVRLTPRSSKDAVTGIERTADGRSHVAAKVRAVPEKGAANAALERLVAAWLGVAKGSVSVRTGTTSRLKTVHVGGDKTSLARTVRDALRLLADATDGV